MIGKRSQHRFAPLLNFQVALEAVEGEKTLAESSSRFEIQDFAQVARNRKPSE